MGEDKKDELNVLTKIAGLLDVLDPKERQRVLDYLTERYESDREGDDS